MAAPASGDEFLDLVKKSGVADEKRLDAFLLKVRTSSVDPAKLAGLMIQEGVLTNFQAENILAGKWRRFSIGKYKVLEKLGSGGFAQVYLCEHKLMRRRVAVKVLPVAKTKDSSALERFYREARAVAALDHPNIVHAYDIDQDADLHFLVMEFVDGANLQEIVKKSGPLPALRAAHYIRQAALALQHAHENGLVHRDIKPGNILVDRSGTVKVLDIGLALFFNEEDDQLTRKHDDGTLGTADYLSPEQAMDSHDVDIRTDIYSLGVTFYFLLTGKPPFEGLPIAQKLMAHQMKQPRPIAEIRKDVPAGVLAILDKMLAKKVTDRYDAPGDVADALDAFTQTPIAPPADAELPKLSPAATGQGPESSDSKVTPAAPPPPRVQPEPVKKAAAAVAAPPPPKAPTPAKPIPAAAVAEAPPEATPWLNADTHTSKSQEETAPMPPRPAAKHQPVSAEKRGRLFSTILILGFVVIPIVLVIAITAGVFIFAPEVFFPPPPPHKREPPKLAVSRDRPGAERTIQAALRKAEIGSVIELWDEKYDQNVIIEPQRGRTQITLQAAQGVKSIVWRSASDKPTDPIIKVAKGPELKLKGKGITLDGTMSKGRYVNDLMMITSDCPDMVADDFEFTNFGRSAVFIINAAGTEPRPLKLMRLMTLPNAEPKPAAAVFFDANPKVIPYPNDHIHIEDCDFRGFDPAKAVHNKDNSALGKCVKWDGR